MLVKKHIAEQFNRATQTYNAHALIHHQIGWELLKKIHSFSPKNILDVGTGTGLSLQLLQQRFPKSVCIASDIAHSLLSIAQNTVKTASFVCADFDSLPFAEKQFDLVFSNLALQWSPNIAESLTSLRKLLKPNGQLIFSLFGAASLPELRASWKMIDNFNHHTPLPLYEELQKILLPFNGSLSQRTTTGYYPNVNRALLSIKNIGASYVINRQHKALMGKQRWQRFMDNYEQHRTNKGIPVSYEIFYGVLMG